VTMSPFNVVLSSSVGAALAVITIATAMVVVSTLVGGGVGDGVGSGTGTCVGFIVGLGVPVVGL